MKRGHHYTLTFASFGWLVAGGWANLA